MGLRPDSSWRGSKEGLNNSSGCTGAQKREEMGNVNAMLPIAAKPSTIKATKSKRDQREARMLERLKASVRAKGEHPFRVVKRQLGYAKARYRGIAKNTAQVLTLFALSNLWMSRRRLLPATG